MRVVVSLHRRLPASVLTSGIDRLFAEDGGRCPQGHLFNQRAELSLMSDELSFAADAPFLAPRAVSGREALSSFFLF
jgi:hypothetical protein